MLDYKWRYPGWALIIVGVIFTVLYVNFDFRLSLPIFAVFSYFSEMKFMVTYTTNVTDEIMMLCLLIGFFLLVFSKDRNVLPEFENLRGKALYKALFNNSIIMFVSILFIYGQGFFIIMVLNLYSVFILYLIFYSRLKRKVRLNLESQIKID